MKRNSSKFRRRLQSGQYKRRRRRRREAEGGKERRENNESHQWPIVDRFKYRMLSRVHSQSVSLLMMTIIGLDKEQRTQLMWHTKEVKKPRAR